MKYALVYCRPTVMPWMMYAGMTESDLNAMYAYLKTLKPIKNPVVKFTTPKLPG